MTPIHLGISTCPNDTFAYLVAADRLDRPDWS